MPPPKNGKAPESNFTQTDILQAVIVADRFDERFSPITDEIPLALFPVANKPLISYTLDFLVSAGVQQIYVYCCNHAAKIKDYLAESKWNSKCSQCQITPIVSSNAISLGDVIRDFNERQLYESDFLLVCGDVIANVSLEQALNEHREKRAKDKLKPIMTVLLRNCATNHIARPAEDDLIVVLDSNTRQVLCYEKVDTTTTKVSSPLKSFHESDKCDIHYNLVDVGIAICSSQVSKLFAVHFDYESREEFIEGTLSNEECLRHQIHAHITNEGLAFRVSSMHMYDTISKLIISRWLYPYVPDHDHERGVRPWSNEDRDDCSQLRSTYQHMRRNVYLNDRIKMIGRGSVIEKNSIIGSGVSIGYNCKISNSVIGSDCNIGDGATIINSYLWSEVTVRDCANIEKATLCDKVIVHDNTTVKEGCVFGVQVEVGPNTIIQEGTVIHLETDEDTYAEGVMTKDPKSTIFGAKARGVLWSRAGIEGSDEEVEQDGAWGMSLSERNNVCPDDESDTTENEFSESEEDSAEDNDYEEGDTTGNALSESDEQSDETDEKERKVRLFSEEVEDSIARAIAENIATDNLILEINASKYAHNVSIHDRISTVTRSAFKIAKTRAIGNAYFFSLRKVLLYLCPVFVKYIKSCQSQIDCLREIERYCLQNKHGFDCLMKVLLLLYKNDVIAEEVILHWHEKPSAGEDTNHMDLTPQKLRSSVQKFINWLKEAEEESDDDED